MAEAAVVGREMDRGAGVAKIVNAGGQVGGADAVVERDALDPAVSGFPAVAARTEELADVGQERRLADAAGDEADVVAAGWCGKAVAERAPDFKCACRLAARPASR